MKENLFIHLASVLSYLANIFNSIAYSLGEHGLFNSSFYSLGVHLK